MLVDTNKRDTAAEIFGHKVSAPIGFAHCDNPGEAIAEIEAFGLAAGDAVLVKGSNSVGLGRVVAHFADRRA